MTKFSRKDFIKGAALAGLGIYANPIKAAMFDEPKSDKTKTKLKIGFIGTGMRGQDHLELALKRNDVEIPAICDIQQVMIDSSLKLFKDAGKPFPQVYSKSDYAYRELLNRKDLDAVIIATPWELHYQMSIDALDAGKHVGCEVIMATNIEEHWDIIRKVEKTGLQYMMLENVCYRRDIMAIMNMIRQNIFGELIHLQGGYQHDLRAVKFNDGKQPYGGGVEFGEKGYSEAQWRTQHSVMRNGELYPTHGIGPISKMINIHAGNRFTSLVSYSSKSRGLHQYITEKGGEKHPNTKVNFKLGDIVTTMINTANKETILLQHDTSLPRPYSLGFRVQGVKGIWMDINKSIYVEGLSKTNDKWEEAKPYLENYDHPLWKRFANEAEGAGHGGMDFFVLNAFVEAIKRGEPTPISVYDSAAWSAITPLSEISIEKGGQSVDFPDFSGGRWMRNKQLFALNDQY
jgi:hypothetical protein